jgi:hypothetical protein
MPSSVCQWTLVAFVKKTSLYFDYLKTPEGLAWAHYNMMWPVWSLVQSQRYCVFINTIELYWIATINKYFNMGCMTFRSLYISGVFCKSFLVTAAFFLLSKLHSFQNDTTLIHCDFKYWVISMNVMFKYKLIHLNRDTKYLEEWLESSEVVCLCLSGKLPNKSREDVSGVLQCSRSTDRFLHIMSSSSVMDCVSHRKPLLMWATFQLNLLHSLISSKH